MHFLHTFVFNPCGRSPLTLPSPVLMSTSTAYTSCTSNSTSSWSFLQKQGVEILRCLHVDQSVRTSKTEPTHFCWSVGFWMTVFSPSMTCCFSWWESIPATQGTTRFPSCEHTAGSDRWPRWRLSALTFDGAAIERLCNLVPGLCDLRVLMNDTE